MYSKQSLKLLSYILGAFIGLTGCSVLTNNSLPEETVTEAEEVEETVTQLTYLNSSVFDQGVINEMTVPNRYILVDFTESITLNTIPERIESWLQRVSDNNGVVELEPVDPDEQDRGLGLLVEPILNLIFQAYIGSGEDEIDSLTSNYNIRIYYMQDSGVINKLLFYPTK